MLGGNALTLQSCLVPGCGRPKISVVLARKQRVSVSDRPTSTSRPHSRWPEAGQCAQVIGTLAYLHAVSSDLESVWPAGNFKPTQGSSNKYPTPMHVLYPGIQFSFETRPRVTCPFRLTPSGGGAAGGPSSSLSWDIPAVQGHARGAEQFLGGLGCLTHWELRFNNLKRVNAPPTPSMVGRSDNVLSLAEPFVNICVIRLIQDQIREGPRSPLEMNECKQGGRMVLLWFGLALQLKGSHTAALKGGFFTT